MWTIIIIAYNVMYIMYCQPGCPVEFSVTFFTSSFKWGFTSVLIVLVQWGECLCHQDYNKQKLIML